MIYFKCVCDTDAFRRSMQKCANQQSTIYEIDAFRIWSKVLQMKTVMEVCQCRFNWECWHAATIWMVMEYGLWKVSYLQTSWQTDRQTRKQARTQHIFLAGCRSELSQHASSSGPEVGTSMPVSPLCCTHLTQKADRANLARCVLQICTQVAPKPVNYLSSGFHLDSFAAW